MRMPSGTQHRVSILPVHVMFDGVTRPVVDCSSKPAIAAGAHLDRILLAAAFRNWRHATQRSQTAVVSSLQRLPGFCEHRGAHQCPHARQGLEEECVTVLSFSLGGSRVLFEQPLDVAFHLDLLFVDQAKSWNEQRDTSARCFCNPWRHS